ncbi:MAG: hypothetical protein ACK4ND_18470 [Cytophagaceae bacterium]
MSDYKKKEDGQKQKPHIPHFPEEEKKEGQDENDPNPNSNENYSYYPGVAYPEGLDENDSREPDKDGPESL